MFKFLHAADLHIDSPLRGLDLEHSARADRLRRATRDAFSNLLTLAIDERVDFVIVAGDLFDGQWPDMRTGLWTAEQFRRLREHNIRVYLIRGNHDALSVVAPAITWPADVVCEFDTKSPQTIVDKRTGAVLHGQSYADRRAPGDLAANYPAAERGAFNIGVLHTSLSGDPNHIPYAPTTKEVLAARGYDYWALGHVHRRQIVQQSPHVVFPGNTQGRHIKEPGAKGCYIVTVDGHAIDCQFRETDVIRWSAIDLALPAGAEEADLFEELQTECDHAMQQAEGRRVVARVTISGACKLHEQFANSSSRARLVADIKNQAQNYHDEVWIEQVDAVTRPLVDLDQWRLGGDVVGELLRSLDDCRRAEASLDELDEHLRPLFSKVSDALGEELDAADRKVQLARWLDQAESLLVGELAKGEA